MRSTFMSLPTSIFVQAKGMTPNALRVESEYCQFYPPKHAPPSLEKNKPGLYCQ
jgi:hypothetical protein